MEQMTVLDETESSQIREQEALPATSAQWLDKMIDLLALMWSPLFFTGIAWHLKDFMPPRHLALMLVVFMVVFWLLPVGRSISGKVLLCCTLVVGIAASTYSLFAFLGKSQAIAILLMLAGCLPCYAFMVSRDRGK